MSDRAHEAFGFRHKDAGARGALFYEDRIYVDVDA